MQIVVMVAVILACLVIAAQAVAFVVMLRGQRQLASSNKEIVQYLRNVDTLLGGVSRALSHVPAEQRPLPIGAEAPTFALPDLGGRERRLDEFRGKPLVLGFFSTTCGFCQQMAPRLGELPADAPRVVLVSRGDVDEHLEMAAKNKWHCDVLLEPAAEVMSAYKSNGTPSAYLIDAEGRIASALAVGADEMLALIEGTNQADGAPDLTAHALHQKQAAAVDKAREAGLSLRASTIQRDGLRAGTPAPDFTLPDLEGQSYRLEDFRDKRVLLVFSDPKCGPCEALVAELVRLQRAHSNNNLQIVMISRGDAKENRQKVTQQGVTFPVLLQNQWEVSRQYAMFATPIGYLIDEKGVIAKDVAIGKSAILSLV